MIWAKDRFNDAYSRIQEDAKDGGCTVLLCVAPDCDALCACRILTSMFRRDNISYKVKPVASYGDIKVADSEVVKGNDELRTVIMLNCGGTIHVTDVLSLNPETTCFVIDSHRPIHLANVYHDDKVVVLDDGTLQSDDRMPSDGSDLSANEDGVSSDDDSDSFDESDDAEAGDGSGRRKRKRGGASPRRKRRRLLQEYYATTYYGYPAASIAYNLAQQLNHDVNELLWLAIVGMTQHYLHGNMDQQRYVELVQDYRQEVMTKNPLEQQMVVAADGVEVRMAENGRITFEEDYRFMLHRHWSLYNAMYYSDYVAARLGVWKADGKAKLERFLAKMGLPLQACKQKFCFMNKRLKQRLRHNVEHFAQDFQLEEITMGSFQCHDGYNRTKSAADMVYSVTALLENDSGDASEGGRQNWLLNFNQAYDSLARRRPRHDSTFHRGLTQSMELQKSVVNLGTAVMEKNVVRSAGPFRYCTLNALGETDANIFTRPLALGKLARWVVNANREGGRWRSKKARPFVMAALNERRGTYMVVGVMCPGRFWEAQRNLLGRAFREAALQINARYRHDGFDLAVMELEKGAIKNFLAVMTDALAL